MIGDFKNLNRSFAYLKAFAAYNMVMIHGYSMLSTVTLIEHFKNPFQYISIFRGFFSLCLPAYAGFYLRAETGPHLFKHRLAPHFIIRGLQFFIFACLIDALTIACYSMSIHPIFDWHPLNFIGLCMVIVYLLLCVHQYILPIFVVLIIITRPILEQFYANSIYDASAVSAEMFLRASWIWSGLFAALISFSLYCLSILFFGGAKKGLRWAIYPAFVLLGALAAQSMQPFILYDKRTLLSFLNLPHDIFFSNPASDNYWPFFPFFPLFISGYYIRDFLYHLKSIRSLQLALATTGAYLIYFFVYKLSEYNNKLSDHAIITKELFSMNFSHVFGIICFFFWSYVVTYYFIRNRKFNLIDRWAYYSRSVLVIYVVHSLVLALLRDHFPSFLIAALSNHKNIQFVIPFLLLTAGYIITLFLSHKTLRLFTGLTGRLNYGKVL